MATGDMPASTPSEQAIQTPPVNTEIVPAEERIPLAPLPQRPVAAPPRFLARLRVLDVLLILLVVGFAFEAACYRALNTDAFLHLAAGRAVANGTFLSSSDLFTYGATTAWVNHSWLPDFIAYQLYQALGHDTAGIVFVILKSLVIAGLAIVLVQAGSLPGRSQWIPALCTLLGILVLSPRALLQPTVLSFFLLGLTLLLLERIRCGKVSPWLLPVVCVLWVNLDAWFLLGLLTIGLYLLGEFLQRIAGESDDATPAAVTPARLGLVFAACIAACVLNPFHVRAFTLPASLDFSAAGTVLHKDPLFRLMYLASWDELYFSRTIGLSAAGLSYFVLLAVGLVSFGLTAPRWRWWRVLVWLAFAALSLFNMRLIPFFAVVAVPISALNLLDGLARFYGADIRGDLNSRQTAVAGRVGSLVVALILILLSVPGWLQAEPHENRQFGVGLRIDEGLRDAALTVKSWRDQGALPENARFFNTSPEVVNYFAWFCPEERCFLDFRLPLFDKAAAEDFNDVRKSLQGDEPSEPGEGGQRQPGWRRVLGKHKASFLVFHSHNPIAQPATLQRLQSNPDEFTSCYLGGATTILAWRDPLVADRPKVDERLVRDFDAEAFGPKTVPAPEERPAPPAAATWYSDLLPAPTFSSLDRDTAFLHEMRFDGLELRYMMENQMQIQAQLAAPVVAQAGLPGGPLVNSLLFPLRINHTFTGRTRDQPGPMDAVAQDLLRRYIMTQDSGPPASMYLAIRAARRALEKNPKDIDALLILGRCYGKLASRTRERAMSFRLVPHVELIRQTQTTAALRNVLKLDPRPEQERMAHMLLMEAYRGPQFLDARVKHLGKYLEISRKIGHLPGVPPNRLKEALDAQQKRLAELEKERNRLRDTFEVQSANKPVLEKVRIALSSGLGETALDLLEKVSDPKELANPANPRETAGGQLAVDLMLLLGEPEKAREVLAGDTTAKDNEAKQRVAFGTHQLNLGAYNWFSVQLAAGSGDYATADKILGEMIVEAGKNDGAWQVLEGMEVVAPAYGVGKDIRLVDFSGMLVGHILLDQASRASGPIWQARHLTPVHGGTRLPRRPGWQVPLAQGVGYLTSVMKQQADLWTIRAWLSLEAGQIERARQQAKEAVRLSNLGPAQDGQPMLLDCADLAAMVQELAEGNKLRSR